MRFRNRHLVAGFVVDFFCPALRLAVEVDGDVHENQVDYDEDRTRTLATYGVTVVRVSNDDVLPDMNRALEIIHAAITALTAQRT